MPHFFEKSGQKNSIDVKSPEKLLSVFLKNGCVYVQNPVLFCHTESCTAGRSISGVGLGY